MASVWEKTSTTKPRLNIFAIRDLDSPQGPGYDSVSRIKNGVEPCQLVKISTNALNTKITKTLTPPMTCRSSTIIYVTRRPRASTPLGRSTASASWVTMAMESYACLVNTEWLLLCSEKRLKFHRTLVVRWEIQRMRHASDGLWEGYPQIMEPGPGRSPSATTAQEEKAISSTERSLNQGGFLQ